MTETALDKIVRLAATNEAPYKIFKSGSKFVVKNNAGVVKSTFDTAEEARQYQKALYANVPGAAKAADRKPFTGNQKRAVSA